MTKLSFLSFFFLVSISSTIAGSTSKPSFLPRANKNKAIITQIPRGGGGLPVGPIDAKLAQKLFSGIFGANAAMCGLAPKLAQSAYSLPENPATERLMQAVGGVGMSHAVLISLQVFKGMSFEQAMGWSIWPYVLVALYQAQIAKSDAAIGFPSKNHILSCAINLLVFYASQTKASWAPNLYKAYGFWSVLNAIPMLFFPMETSKIWMMTLDETDERANFMMRTLAYFLLAHGVTVIMQCGSATLGNVLMWTALTQMTSILGMVMTGKFAAAEVPTATSNIWMLFLAAIANSLRVNTIELVK